MIIRKFVHKIYLSKSKAQENFYGIYCFNNARFNLLGLKIVIQSDVKASENYTGNFLY